MYLCALVGVSSAAAQTFEPRDPELRSSFRYVDVAAAAGLSGAEWAAGSGFGAGAAAADYDEDGDIDLFIPTGAGTPDRLYRNDGDGTFTDIATTVGVGSTESHRMALWFDYDNDGDLDLLTVGDCYRLDCAGFQGIQLYRQEHQELFTESTTPAGLTGAFTLGDNAHAGGLAAGDIDRDGDLDLYIAFWKARSLLLANNGDGTFSDIGAAAGVDVDQPLWQPVMWDFNHDGWLDIFLAIDFKPNKLMLNNADGTFSEVAAAAGVNYDANDMGVALGDYDNDGDFDLYVTNIFRDGDHNVLYRMDGVDGDNVPVFSEVSEAAGVQDGRWGWGATFLDADRDGWLDLATTNGATKDEWLTDESQFFLSRGGPNPTFARRGAVVGFNDTYWGSALLALDHDRDGDLDLLQTCYAGGPLRLLRSDTLGRPRAGWLTVIPRQAGANKFAVGAIVRVVAGETMLSRPIHCGISFLGQEPYEAHFGIPPGSERVDLQVIWPDGHITNRSVAAINRIVEISR